MIEDERRDIEQYWPVVLNRNPGRKALEHLVSIGELTEEQAQFIWDQLLAPLYDTMAARSVYTRRRRCRICGRPHPDSPTGSIWIAKGKTVPGHAMYCPSYVGSLEHRPTLYEKAVVGYRHVCLCGKSYPDEEGAQCPDAAVDRRGPIP